MVERLLGRGSAFAKMGDCYVAGRPLEPAPRRPLVLAKVPIKGH